MIPCQKCNFVARKYNICNNHYIYTYIYQRAKNRNNLCNNKQWRNNKPYVQTAIRVLIYFLYYIPSQIENMARSSISSLIPTYNVKIITEMGVYWLFNLLSPTFGIFSPEIWTNSIILKPTLIWGQEYETIHRRDIPAFDSKINFTF